MIDSIINRTYLRSISLVCSLYSLLESRIFRVIKACFSKFATSSICAFLLLLCLGLFSSGIVLAQEEPGEEQQETPQTHAQSESMKWNGIDVNTVICENSRFAPNPGPYTDYNPSILKYPFEKGKVIFLYNVGTGKFLIEGGNFGMEGRLFHDTFGRPLYLYSDGYILSGIKESNNKFIFGCNVPGTFHQNSDWNKWGDYSFTIMMDADISKRTKGWQFQRVDPDADTHTYYMYEDKGGKQYYLGAAYGECHALAWKGDGKLVFMDDDRATWTTHDPRTDTTLKEVNGENIPLNELYQWRLVDEDEFRSMLDNEDIGLNPSVSIFITDRDFTRNSQVFNDAWKVDGNPDGTNHRLGFTYGSSGNGNGSSKQNLYNTNQKWNKPIRLKHVFDGNNSNGEEYVNYDDNSNYKVKYGWKNSKYGFLTFEGVGRTYTEEKVPEAGWYLVQCYGFVQSDEGHEAYLFARVKDSNETSSTGGEAQTMLKTVPAGTFTGKNLKDNCLVVGKELTQNGENYKNTVWICVTEEQFNSGLDVLQIGVGKDQATRSEVTVNGGKDYYYDTDWVCVDDFRMSYLGLRPAFFYEDEENLNYLNPNSPDYYIDSDATKAKQYQGASPTGQYAGAICVERSLKTNQWNSFSFPLPLTGEQIRFAFGEDAQLATIHSIGGMSKNPNVIDFKTKDLFTSEAVVKPGQFYLLKPTKEPLAGIDPRGKEVTYYELGRKFFSARENETSDYTHFKLPLSTLKDASETIIKDEDPAGIAHVNYVQTPDYNNIINSHEYYDGGSHGIYATTGSYVVSYNANKEATTIYHINKNTPLKGFRGWIVLDEPIAPSDVKMSVYDKFDGGHEDTSIESLPMVVTQLSADTEVYDLCGRKVGALGSNLPKGIYLVNGRKYFVK